MVLGGVTRFRALIRPDTFENIWHWGLGSIDRKDLAEAARVAPFNLVGLLIAMMLSESLNPTALGDDLAASLGTRVGRVRVFGIIAVTLLAGGGAHR